MAPTESRAAILSRELRELCRKKGTHSLEVLKQTMDSWRSEFNLEPHEYLNIGNSHGKTPLHFAAQLRDDGLTEHLLSLRADPNSMTVRGHTALVFASGRGRNETVLNLLEAGAKSRVAIVNGDTALSLGSSHGLVEEVLQTLREAEENEQDPWLDFTKDKLAIEVQADHIMTKPQCAQWKCDVPPLVAECLKQRAAKLKNQVSAEQAGADALAATLTPLWNKEEAFADALLAACSTPTRKKNARQIVKDGLLAVAKSLPEDELKLYIVGLLHTLSMHLSHLSKKAAADDQCRKQAKHGKVLATSALMCVLKELRPLSCGLTVETLATESPPWTVVDLLSPPIGVDLVSDAPFLKAILNRLCHATAWGSDFGTALRWLRMLRPGEDASEEEHKAFHMLATAFVEGATAACQAGNSLKRNLHENRTLFDEMHDVLEGIDLDELHEAAKGNSGIVGNIVLSQEISEEIEAVPPLGPPYLALPVSASISWVGDAATWNEAEQAINQSEVATIDTEWWGTGNGPALIQIAVNGTHMDRPNCFLIDTWCDGSSEAEKFREVVSAGLIRIFSNPDIRIVGWSFGEDAKRLKELCGGEDCSCDFTVLDLQKISTHLVSASARNGCTEGLSVTCARFLGMPLDKAQQCSDWRQRPLSDAQRNYAALDAIVLLDLHRVLTGLPTIKRDQPAVSKNRSGIDSALAGG